MTARAIWKAHLRFGAVDVPVKLYSAVQDRTVHFRLLDAKRHEPVRQHMVDPATGDVVAPAEVRRAFESDDGALVMLDEKALDALEPAPSRDIDVARFVPAKAITHEWYDRPYFLGPDGEAGAYFALARALREREAEGVARWVMRGREYVGALRAEGDYLTLITLRHAGEVVPASALPAPAGRPLAEREVDMAKQLVAAMEDPFDITDYHDEYRERVRELMEARAAGKVVKFPRARARKTEASLTDVLERSLKATEKERKRA